MTLRESLRPGRVFVAAVQIAAIGAAIWFLAHTARAHWGTVALGDLRPAWGPLLLASALTLVTYLYLVAWWITSLGWWGPRLAYLDALRIWFTTNLARFIPGIVWQFAGLAAMVQPYGVSAVAATGGVVIQQIIVLATGLALIAAAAPALLGPWAASLPAWVPLVSASLVIALVVMILPRSVPLLARLVSLVMRRPIAWSAPPRGAFAWYVIGVAPVWLVYGVSFWLFARALFGASAPAPMVAGTAFVASYVAGLLAVFAPSGLLVREAALVAALAGSMGGAAALILAIAARLWLVALEVVATVTVLAIHRLSGGR